MNEVEQLYNFFEHHPLQDGPARIEREDADDELEQGLEASLAMLSLEFAELDTALEDTAAFTAAVDAYDTSIALSTLHEALRRPDTMEWMEAI